MTRKEEILNIIKSGSSVFVTIDGMQKVIHAGNLDELPSDADLAAGNPEAEAQALGDIEKEMKKLSESKEKLEASKKKEDAKKEDEPKKEDAKKDDKK